MVVVGRRKGFVFVCITERGRKAKRAAFSRTEPKTPVTSFTPKGTTVLINKQDSTHIYCLSKSMDHVVQIARYCYELNGLKMVLIGCIWLAFLSVESIIPTGVEDFGTSHPCWFHGDAWLVDVESSEWFAIMVDPQSPVRIWILRGM